MFVLTLVLLSSQVLGQQLTHHMSEEEKALMPAYLDSLNARIEAVTPPPPTAVRNIAEFETMEGVLIAYPLGIPVSLVALMSEEIIVTTIVDDATEENTVRNYYTSNGVTIANCNFIHAPHDSHWTRDYGPWYIMDGTGTVGIMDFTYNRPRNNDNAIPSAMATFLGVNLYEMDLVTAGGNYMTDGLGISVSTDLIWDENSHTPAEIDQIVNDYLGVHTYHVTMDPLADYIKHVDCWGKYLDVDKILLGRVPVTDSRYADYEALATYFANETSSYGNHYIVHRVDSPDGQPYTNSLILNDRVFVPITNSPEDSAAIQAYENAMPGYRVYGVTGSWYSTDALHCRAKGIADRGMLYVKHLPLLGEKPQQASYQVNAEIVPYSGMPIVSGSAKIYYQVNGGAFFPVTMTNTSGNTYSADIPGQSQGSEIGYYITVSDTSGRTSNHPLIGSPDPHEFSVAAPPQVPVADFTANTTTVIEGSSVQFTDQSANTPTSWSWSFTGGTPSTSTDQDPMVTYNTAGTYSVTLTASNSAGSDDETKVDYITVLPLSACLGTITNPDFETGSTSGWTVTGGVTVDSTSHTGSYGVYLDSAGETVEQVVTGLCSNTTYMVSAWGLARSNAGVYLGVKNYGGSEQTAQFTDSKNWQQKSISFTTGSTDTSVTIFFTKTAGGRFGGNGDDFELIIVN
jgi:PKD repeat protein/agmatine/peptidylarginine deiminase